MSSRQLFYVHALIVLCLGVTGTSASLLEAIGLNLNFIVLPLYLASLVAPLMIFIVAINEKRTPGTILAAVALSGILTVASLYAILPLVM